ncbi:hypothetical protein CEXT_26131 [Caerostris extrusa]|uniref:Uncharacterized protein n=1 Tax=Caerostris extrusa TaxID=172846 RepID=A0AAV4YB92_CAEEX|nr:hypothetical protein CEXT_26131 [Caerostris extrusa]
MMFNDDKRLSVFQPSLLATHFLNEDEVLVHLYLLWKRYYVWSSSLTMDFQMKILTLVITANLCSMYITYPEARIFVLLFIALCILCSSILSLRTFMLELFEVAENSFAYKVRDEL